MYVPLLVSANQLRDFFQLATDLPISGFSVTIPHKRRIMRYLDQVDPLAKRIGAVNTVWRKAGKWRGANTDAEAISGPLSKLIKLPKATALIYGSVKDNLGNPLVGLDVYANDNNNLYQTDGYTDASGNYVLGVLGLGSSDSWYVQANANNTLTNYVFSQGNGSIRAYP